MKTGKLVRDKIPEIIKKGNRMPITHIASNEEYKEKLNDKLKEEVEEFLKAPNEEELADILEVIQAIISIRKIDKAYLEKLRKEKQQKRGGFKERLILDKIK